MNGIYNFVFQDSPAVPASAATHELFRGFSYVAPLLTEETPAPQPELAPGQGGKSNAGVSKLKLKTAGRKNHKTGVFAQVRRFLYFKLKHMHILIAELQRIVNMDGMPNIFENQTNTK